MKSEIINIENKIEKPRQAGFEILRILCAFLIISVHLLNAGGMLANSTGGRLMSLRLLYALFTPAVNIFVLISAYFLVTSNINYKRLIPLWFAVLIYTLIGYGFNIFYYNSPFHIRDFILCFLPITSNKFWFFTAYFLLYLFAPFLNKMIKSLTQKEHLSLCIAIFVLTWLALEIT